MERLLSLTIFLALVVITSAIAGQFVGADWYLTVKQPTWNPPAMVMASVWAVLYVLMAVSAWMIWEAKRGLAYGALGWWVLQLLFNMCWSWVFFGLHRPGWALALMSLWLLVVLMVIKSFRPIKQEASGLMMPVAVWLLFSWALSFVQWHLSGGGIDSIF